MPVTHGVDPSITTPYIDQPIFCHQENALAQGLDARVKHSPAPAIALLSNLYLRYHHRMSRFGTEYHIARSTGRCSATGQLLEPGSACIATLCERAEDEGFDRLDFSLPAWEAGSRPAALFSHWKTVVAPPDAKPKLLVDDEVLFDLFTRLAADDRPQRVAFRFVLGLILIRKKVLKVTARRVDGEVEHWLLQPKSNSGSGGFETAQPPIQLTNPRLSDDDVRELIGQLSEILQSEL